MNIPSFIEISGINSASPHLQEAIWRDMAKPAIYAGKRRATSFDTQFAAWRLPSNRRVILLLV
jgi:hypothetical protein